MLTSLSLPSSVNTRIYLHNSCFFIIYVDQKHPVTNLDMTKNFNGSLVDRITFIN